MTREEQVNICRCCEHHKLDMTKGIVCKKTGEHATFDEECPDFSGSGETPKDTQANEPSEIKGFFAFYLYWSIPIGVIITIIKTLFSYDSASYLGSGFLLCADIALTLIYTYLGIYVIYAFIKQRSDAVFMAKYQLLYLFLSNILVIAVGDSESMTFSSIIWSIIFFLYICFSEDVKDRIPKETRKLTKINRYFVPISLIIPVVCFLLGLAEIAQGHSFFANPEDKLKDLCLITQSTLPDGNLHSMYVDGKSIVYGLDEEFGELSKEAIDRLAITLRESILAGFEVDAETREFFNLCVEADFDVVYKYTDRDAGTCVTVTITPDKLEKAIEPGYKHVITPDAWNEVLTYYNASLPLVYFEDCYLENVSVNDFQKTIRYDLKLVNMSVSELNGLTNDDFEYHMRSIFEDVSDDVMILADYAGYDVEYSFTADCLSWWSKSVTLEHDEIFE